MGEPQYLKFPILPLAQSVFGLASPTTDTATKKTSLKTLQDAIREHKMAPLYAHLAHPQTGKLNASGEGGSLSPSISRANTNASSPSPYNTLRRTSSINAPSIVGVLGGKTDKSVDLPWDEALYNELKADNEKELETIDEEEFFQLLENGLSKEKRERMAARRAADEAEGPEEDATPPRKRRGDEFIVY